jgi:UV DNA damage repair endonuclease
MARSSLTYIPGFSVKFFFSRYIPIMQIRHILIKDCKGTIQESFQQSLVEIGSVVSEEKIFVLFHPPFFLICIIGQNRQKFKIHKKNPVIYAKVV